MFEILARSYRCIDDKLGRIKRVIREIPRMYEALSDGMTYVEYHKVGENWKRVELSDLANKWISLSRGQVIGEGQTYHESATEAQQKGYHEPFTTFVDESDDIERIS
jgi:hypothetical protein